MIAQDTYNVLKHRGHEVYYFALDKKPYLENKPWVKYFPKYYNHFVPQYFWNIEAQYNLKRMLEDIKPDIVHLHIAVQLSYSIFKPIFAQNIPVVYTVHDTGILCPAGLARDYHNKIICKKCKCLNTLPCVINNCIASKKRLSSFNVAFKNFLEKLRLDKTFRPGAVSNRARREENSPPAPAANQRKEGLTK